MGKKYAYRLRNDDVMGHNHSISVRLFDLARTSAIVPKKEALAPVESKLVKNKGLFW